MQEPTSQRRDDGGYYGIGWTVIPPDVIRHDGGMPEASATLVLIPAEQIAVAVVCGTKSDLPQQVASKIVTALRPFGSRIELSGRRVSRRMRKRPPRPFVPMTLTVERSKGLWAKLGADAERKLWGAGFRDGYLTGWTRGHLGAEGTRTRRRSCGCR